MNEQIPEATPGWRHGHVWTYTMAAVTSLMALFSSLILAAETLQLARNPQGRLSCDINAVVSCSTVAGSWQAELIHLGTLPIPNAFLGLAAEAVFLTLAVVGLSGVGLPSWMAGLTWLGSLLALAYAVWLFTQSVFVISALCPWCLVMLASTSIQFMAFSHATVTVQGLPSSQGHMPGLGRGLRAYYRLHFDLMVDLVWLAALITIILSKEGAAIFG